MSIRLTIVMTAILAASGCSTMTPEQEAEMYKMAGQPVYCEGKDDCDLKWGLAIDWIKANAYYKIDHIGKSMISTRGPEHNEANPAYWVIRVPQGNDKYRIDFDGRCDNLFGCIPSIVESRADFNKFVRT
jgi:hypothetical protein